MSKETPVQTVTDSNPKVSKSNRTPTQFFSKKDTRPFADVYNAEGKLVVGLTEDQRIAEGIRLPYVQRPDFTKTQKEREELKKVHTSAKFPGNWPKSESDRNSLPKHTLIVHLSNFKKDPEFKTTYTFKDVKQNEISRIFGLIINLNRNNENDNYMNHIVKYHFAGVTVNGNGKRG